MLIYIPAMLLKSSPYEAYMGLVTQVFNWQLEIKKCRTTSTTSEPLSITSWMHVLIAKLSALCPNPQMHGVPEYFAPRAHIPAHKWLGIDTSWTSETMSIILDLSAKKDECRCLQNHHGSFQTTETECRESKYKQKSKGAGDKFQRSIWALDLC